MFAKLLALLVVLPSLVFGQKRISHEVIERGAQVKGTYSDSTFDADSVTWGILATTFNGNGSGAKVVLSADGPLITIGDEITIDEIEVLSETDSFVVSQARVRVKKSVFETRGVAVVKVGCNPFFLRYKIMFLDQKYLIIQGLLGKDTIQERIDVGIEKKVNLLKRVLDKS